MALEKRAARLGVSVESLSEHIVGFSIVSCALHELHCNEALYEHETTIVSVVISGGIVTRVSSCRLVHMHVHSY